MAKKKSKSKKQDDLTDHAKKGSLLPKFVVLLCVVCIILGTLYTANLSNDLVAVQYQNFRGTSMNIATTPMDPQAAIDAYVGGSMLGLPPDPGPPNLPSVQVEKNTIERGFYGGEGDKAHLGGFTEIDPEGITPELWKDILSYFGIKSLLDVGCGKGISTSWFLLQGVDAFCVEGSHDAVSQNVFPQLGIEPVNAVGKPRVIEHDFSRGPYWPSGTYDAVWAVEFLEHVGRNYQRNYFTVFKKAAVLFVTHSNWGGWHHVEVHDDMWWRVRLESFGFVYSDDLTKKVRSMASPGHVRRTCLVFLNPAVLSLPEHNHLFAEPGCFTNLNPHIECGTGKAAKLTPLPNNYRALEFSEEQHQKWLNLIKEIKEKKAAAQAQQ